jgi:hypothetical protein
VQLHSLVIHKEDDNSPNNDFCHPNNMLWSSLQVLLQLMKDEKEKHHYYQMQVKWQQSHLVEALMLMTTFAPRRLQAFQHCGRWMPR